MYNCTKANNDVLRCQHRNTLLHSPGQMCICMCVLCVCLSASFQIQYICTIYSLICGAVHRVPSSVLVCCMWYYHPCVRDDGSAHGEQHRAEHARVNARSRESIAICSDVWKQPYREYARVGSYRKLYRVQNHCFRTHIGSGYTHCSMYCMVFYCVLI